MVRAAIGGHGMRYLGGAGLCAAVSAAVLIGVDHFRGPLLAGVLLSWLAGGMTGYLWHSRITYGETLGLRACARFLGGALLGVPLAWLVLWVLGERLGWPMWLAAPATTVILFCYHYLNALVAIRWTRLRRPLSAREAMPRR